MPGLLLLLLLLQLPPPLQLLPMSPGPLSTDVPDGPFARNCAFNDAEVAVKGAAAGSTGLACPSLIQSMRHARRSEKDGVVRLGNACEFHWFPPKEACNILSQPRTTIVFIGDSITRHFMHATQMLLRGDPRLGALREDLPLNVTDNCTCDSQFAIKACRPYILKDTNNLTLPHPCPRARILYIGVVEENQFSLQNLAAFVAEESKNSFVVLALGGWGMHNGLKAMPVFHKLVLPTWMSMNWNPRVALLCLGVHSIQDNVLPQYKRVHNNANVKAYNKLMYTHCTRQGIPFFDTFGITENATSYDGIHYAFVVNVLKAQLLVNHVASLQRPLPQRRRSALSCHVRWALGL